MARAINESDWWLFRKLEPIALDRFWQDDKLYEGWLRGHPKQSVSRC